MRAMSWSTPPSTRPPLTARTVYAILRYTGMPLPAGALRGTSDPRPVPDPTKHRSHAEITSDTAAGDEASATVMSLPGSRPMDGLSAVNRARKPPPSSSHTRTSSTPLRSSATVHRPIPSQGSTIAGPRHSVVTASERRGHTADPVVQARRSASPRRGDNSRPASRPTRHRRSARRRRRSARRPGGRSWGPGRRRVPDARAGAEPRGKDQLFHQPTGERPELVGQQRPKRLVRAHRFSRVALCEMNPDERAMGTLPQWLRADRRIRRLNRLAVASGLRQFLRQRLEGVHLQLTQPLTREEYPVVVPPREQFAGKSEVGRGHAVHDGVRVQDAPRPAGELTDIHAHPGGQPEGATGHVHQSGHCLLDPPQSRTKASVRVLFGDVGPQLTCDRATTWSTAQAQVRNQALSASREVVHGSGGATS